MAARSVAFNTLEDFHGSNPPQVGCISFHCSSPLAPILRKMRGMGLICVRGRLFNGLNDIITVDLRDRIGYHC